MAANKQQINNVRLYLNTQEETIDLFADPENFKKHTGRAIHEVKELLYRSLQKAKTLSWRNFVKEDLGLAVFDENKEKKNKKKTVRKGIDFETGEITENFFSVNFRKQKKYGTYEDIKLKGNTTKISLQSVLADKDDSWFDQVHAETDKKRLDNQKDSDKALTCKEPITNLQLLWEIIYDITNSNTEKTAAIIKKHFGFEIEVCLQLAYIQFDDTGIAQLSTKAIRHILPLMNKGEQLTEKAKSKVQSLIRLYVSEEEQSRSVDEKLECIKNILPDKKARRRLSMFTAEECFRYLNYWEAAAVVYGSHSSKKVTAKGEIKPVAQHSMNNPIVEKIINETIALVNEVYKLYGFDEVRIELSRELKSSMEERQQMWEAMTENAKKNAWAKQMLRDLRSALIDDNRSVENLDTNTDNKSNIDKIKIIEDVVRYSHPNEYKAKVKEYKLSEPSKAEVKKYLLWLDQNFCCPYTNQPIRLTDVFARGKVVEIEHILPKERYYSDAYSNKVITWREVNLAKGSRTAYEFIVSKRTQNSIAVGKMEFPLVAATSWEQHVKNMFPPGCKRNNLLRKDIPDDPIERTLKETQYINKRLMEKLTELVGEERV